MLDDLRERGVKFRSLTEQIDTERPSSGGIKAQRRVALFQQPGAFEAAVTVFEPLLAAMLGDDQRAGTQQTGRGAAQQAQRGRVLSGRIVRRIEKHQVEGRPRLSFRLPPSLSAQASARCELSQPGAHAARVNLESCRQPQRGQVGAQHSKRGRSALHEDNVRRSTAQRLDSHRARAGIQIQKRRAPVRSFDARRQHVE